MVCYGLQETSSTELYAAGGGALAGLSLGKLLSHGDTHGHHDPAEGETWEEWSTWSDEHFDLSSNQDSHAV